MRSLSTVVAGVRILILGSGVYFFICKIDRMIKHDGYDFQLVMAVTKQQYKYMQMARDFLKLADFNELGVVLCVAAHTTPSSGIAGSALAKELSLTQSTAYRYLDSLESRGQIRIVENKRPKEYGYNPDFLRDIYGDDAPLKRAEFYGEVLNNQATIVETAIRLMTNSQIENSRKNDVDGK